MRTNIVIDEDLMTAAMKAGPFKSKKEAVEAGLKLLARQAAYREILKWRGRLRWDAEPWAEEATARRAPKVASPPRTREPRRARR